MGSERRTGPRLWLSHVMDGRGRGEALAGGTLSSAADLCPVFGGPFGRKVPNNLYVCGGMLGVGRYSCDPVLLRKLTWGSFSNLPFESRIS